MNFKETAGKDDLYDLCEMAKAEEELVLEAKQTYPKYYNHLQFAVRLFHDCFKEADSSASFFVALKAMMEKHLALAALSSMRLHHVQTNFALRHTSETAAWAIFALAHPSDDKMYTDRDADGVPRPSKKKAARMYDWVAKKYPKGNASLKGFKDYTNFLSSHANIIDAYRNFDASDGKKMSLFFFDTFREHHLHTNMWLVANLAMGILGLMKRATKDYPIVTWADDFQDRYLELQKQNEEIARELKEVLDARQISACLQAK